MKQLEFVERESRKMVCGVCKRIQSSSSFVTGELLISRIGSETFSRRYASLIFLYVYMTVVVCTYGQLGLFLFSTAFRRLGGDSIYVIVAIFVLFKDINFVQNLLN